MLSEGIIIALIAAGGSLIGTIAAIQANNSKRQRENEVRDAKVGMRLDSIEHKLDVHNGYAEKLGSIEQSLAVMANEIEHVKRERDDGR